MQSIRITLEINVSALEGKQLPDEETVAHQVIEQLHDLIIEDTAVVDIVAITEINGEPV